MLGVSGQWVATVASCFLSAPNRAGETSCHCHYAFLVSPATPFTLNHWSRLIANMYLVSPREAAIKP